MRSRTKTLNGIIAELIEIYNFPIWVCKRIRNRSPKILIANNAAKDMGCVDKIPIQIQTTKVNLLDLIKDNPKHELPQEFFEVKIKDTKVNIKLIPKDNLLIILARPPHIPLLAIQRLSEEKINELTKLAAKIAHELNNPLDGSIRFINLAIKKLEKALQEDTGLDTLTIAEYLKSAKEALNKMAEILADISEFAKRGQAQIKSISINDLIEQAIKTMSIKLEQSNINVITLLDENLPPAGGTNMYQVFCNLIKNAIDAIEKKKTISPQSAKRIIIRTQKDKDTIKITIEDTGIGLVETEKIFEPFFTTKEEEGGMGLGLSISKEIVEGYKGKITAENTEDGARFTIRLPIIEKKLDRQK